ncbi:unnamed protein product, partial [Laminaria digitata]
LVLLVFSLAQVRSYDVGRDINQGTRTDGRPDPVCTVFGLDSLKRNARCPCAEECLLPARRNPVHSPPSLLVHRWATFVSDVPDLFATIVHKNKHGPTIRVTFFFFLVFGVPSGTNGIFSSNLEFQRTIEHPSMHLAVPAHSLVHPSLLVPPSSRDRRAPHPPLPSPAV